jgi:hypothetical protein
MDRFKQTGSGRVKQTGAGPAHDPRIAYPSLTFDKWRVLALVNGAYDVVDLIQTFF